MDNNEVQQNPEVVTGQVAQEAVEATVQPVAETVAEATVQPAVDVAPAVEPQPAVEAVPAVVPQPEAQPAPVVAAKATKAPAKEIVSMILGITSLCSGVCAIGFAWVPVTGLICAFVFGTIAIGTGIAAKILRKKAVQQATITTKKSIVGKNLATAGIITAAVGIFVAIILTIACVGVAAFAIGKVQEEGFSDINFDGANIDLNNGEINFDGGEISFDENGINFDFDDEEEE